ncbi:hypothetical protein DFJ74DRAFT_687563 [Hyaloraphidium curvatum]|nr:hypothetical protein DFJ74DRAFT_687563 [Hyaloraphidium curvatum]
MASPNERRCTAGRAGCTVVQKASRQRPTRAGGSSSWGVSRTTKTGTGEAGPGAGGPEGASRPRGEAKTGEGAGDGSGGEELPGAAPGGTRSGGGPGPCGPPAGAPCGAAARRPSGSASAADPAWRSGRTGRTPRASAASPADRRRPGLRLAIVRDFAPPDGAAGAPVVRLIAPVPFLRWVGQSRPSGLENSATAKAKTSWDGDADRHGSIPQARLQNRPRASPHASFRAAPDLREGTGWWPVFFRAFGSSPASLVPPNGPFSVSHSEPAGTLNPSDPRRGNCMTLLRPRASRDAASEAGLGAPRRRRHDPKRTPKQIARRAGAALTHSSESFAPRPRAATSKAGGSSALEKRPFRSVP